MDESKLSDDSSDGILRLNCLIVMMMKKKSQNENFKDDEDRINQRRLNSKRYKIQEVIKLNQVILVQVVKDERGQKVQHLAHFFIAGNILF